MQSSAQIKSSRDDDASHSLHTGVGLLNDALHNLADVTTSALDVFGFRISKRPASASFTNSYEPRTGPDSTQAHVESVCHAAPSDYASAQVEQRPITSKASSWGESPV